MEFDQEKSILTLEEAKLALRLDFDDLDNQLIPMLMAIPSYLETATGHTWLDDPVEPLAKTVAIYLIRHWFDGEESYGTRTKIIVDSLLGTLTAMARGRT